MFNTHILWLVACVSLHQVVVSKPELQKGGSSHLSSVNAPTGHHHDKSGENTGEGIPFYF